MPEILLGGNNYGFTPQFSRLDAFKGIVLQNSGNNKWVAQSSKITGWQVKGQLKSIDIFSSSGVVAMVNILNNEKPRVFIMEQMEDL